MMTKGSNPEANFFKFREPEVDDLDATDDEKRLAKKYTRIRRVVVKSAEDAHAAWLIVEGQQFRVSPQYLPTREEASHFCLMVAKALANFQRIESEASDGV